MDTLHVSRLAARYRLPAGEPDARARLDRVLRGVLDDALDQALARAGVPAHEEVCIRRVHAPARLRLGDGDAALAAAWSVALADGIRGTLESGGPGVVRYGSRGHAMVDLLLGVAAGDLRRAWAWRQLGLWSAGEAPSPARSVEEAARALVSRPETIVAALTEAARAGALPALASRIAPAAWTALARAALHAASVTGDAAAALLASPAPHRPPAPSTAQSVDGTVSIPSSVSTSDDADTQSAAVQRILRGSRIAVAVASDASIASADETIGHALAILAVLEAEPSALRRPSADAVLAAVAREMGSVDEDAAPQADLDEADREMRKGREMGDSREMRNGREIGDPERDRIDREKSIDPKRADDRLGRLSEDDDAFVRPESTDQRELLPTRREPADGLESTDDRRLNAEADAKSGSGDGTTDTLDAARAAEGTGDGEEDERPLPEVRTEAVTRWGGLLFLVNLLTSLNVADELLEGDAFAARPLRWTLHRLALELLAMAPRDPAALAFAGLPPDRDPPSRGEPVATEEETAALAALAERLTAALHLRMTGEPAVDARQAEATLREVCRRDATVAADPGWIELRMRLDEVRVDVRRAGLDLDPGWVPWLGAVVRFVYE